MKVEAGGTRYTKLVELYHLTYEAFEDARIKKRLPVHDLDLRRFALNAASVVGLDYFKASKSWITKFKKTYNIVSRKVTKFVTTKSMKNLEITKAAAAKFIDENKALVQRDPKNCINGDQSGFQKELRFGRVLDALGTKMIDVIAQSAYALTHSSTIMPFITAAGQLLEPVLVVLQEKDGKFTDRVEDKLIVPKNLVVCASKSGKMEKRHVEIALTQTVFPHCSTTEVTNLFLDSWSGHTDLKFLEGLTRGTGVKIDVKKLPPGTTDETQPLDKFGFRPGKVYFRKIVEYIILKEIPFVLSKRQNIIFVLAFFVRQLSSPRYNNLWKYSWHACGYTEDHPGPFVTPAQFAFDHDCRVCESPSCRNEAMLRCSWCRSVLCFDHLFTNLPLCDKYVP
ncbi:hypothetical protein B566_EDAN006550 [Ephemera danica]|nr:hypothetical protein B566_EDAN006550 [Ephemera danica]